MADVVPEFEENHLERICRVLGDTDSGLTGSEIGRLLQQARIEDGDPTATKWKRLCFALSNRQSLDGCGNNVVRFIYAAMDPVRYSSEPEVFEHRRGELNQVLIFSGYSLEKNGRLRRQQAAATLDQAQERANQLKAELLRRGVHPDVLFFCRAELIQNNYFHAVFEATKSVAEKIRTLSGLTGDGAALVDLAFGLGQSGVPFLAFNSLQTDTERDEQKGIMNLIKGMFGAFRNVTAHAPKIFWKVTEQDALDLLTIASLIHRRLDMAVRTPRTI
ncbi:MAG TPA: TIGR02391 family protein [Paludibaculum sp.]|jgi:uncharacterized protein (TIGR02391 family)